MAIDFNTENNAENLSFALLRTNPKLASNLKLVVDSEDNIFMSSFKANKVLSAVKYQKFEISDSGIYSNDVARFFKGTPGNVRYQTLRTSSDITPYSEYSNQYENQYNYGASFNSTKLYNEQYKIFAPIWLDRRIPRKFVIYRALGVDYREEYDENTTGQNSRILELLESATIVKTFDLTQDSKIGKYLNTHVLDKGMPTSSIDFNFSESGAIQYKGIDTDNGGFVSKKDYIADDFIRKDNLEIDSNGLITQGFESHKLISANLINMEFMFDDHSAENYKIYRYFGLYVDDINEGSFDIDTVSSDGIISIKPNSTTTTYDVDSAGLTHEDMLLNTSDLKLPILSYINITDDLYLHVDNNKIVSGLRMHVSGIDTNINTEGFVKSINKVNSIPKKISNKGFIRAEVLKRPSNNDRFYIGDKTEIELESYSLYNFTMIADDSLKPGSFINNRFSLAGSLNQIAIAISRLIEYKTEYKTYYKGSTFTIEDYASGNSRKRMSFGVYDANSVDFLNVITGELNDIGLLSAVIPPNESSDFTKWNLYTTSGGSNAGSSFLVDVEELGDIKVGQYAKHRNLTKYSKITNIVPDFLDENIYRVIFDREFKVPVDNVIQMYNKMRPAFGKFSAYDLKDFDFDFYSTSNSDISELKHEEDPGYFTGLSPILYQEAIDSDFKSKDIKSEYDRLNENKLKETSLTSRIVPTIIKFALKNGTNARNLPYILNTNEAFGPNNLSPEIQNESGRNVDQLNMEHFHFNQIPLDYYSGNKLKSLSSYTSSVSVDGISIEQLKSKEVDYFSLYFKWNGTYNNETSEWVDDKFKKLYTELDKGTNELEPSTVFRGLRYVYKKRKEFKESAPTSFIKTSETNGYKFGVTLNYNTGVDINNNSVDYNVIKNDVHKFICVIININVKDNNIKSLNRTLMYDAVDIKKGEDTTDNIIDNDLQFSVDLASVPFANNKKQVPLNAAPFSIFEGNADFINSINRDSEGEYSWLVFSYIENDGTADNTEEYSTENEMFGCVKVISVVNNQQLIINGTVLHFENNTENNPNITRGPVFNAPPIDLNILKKIPWNSRVFYWKAGAGGWKNLLEEIVSYNFAKRFNQYGDITYTTVNKNEEINNGFVLEIQDGIDIVKPSVLDNASDSDRPKSYQLSSTEIGKVIKKREDGGYFTILKRMNGEYNPLFKDCVGFTDIHNIQSTYIPDLGFKTIDNTLISDVRSNLIYSKFKNLGVAFASYKNVDDSYGFINNIHYHKVNNDNSKNLLKLSETSDKLPLYPLIGEIAIDKKDLNIFKSKYSSNYYTKSLPGGRTEEIHGTRSPVELKSFMVSTIMKVKDKYDLTRFSRTTESSIDSLDHVRFNKLNETAIHWIEEDSRIIADFYLPKSIYNELLRDGILSKFANYINPENSFGDKTTISDDLEEYVYSNIVKRFIIENIAIYGILGKTMETDFISVDSPEKIKDGGYTLQTNFEIEGYQNDGLSFRLIYNKKQGYKYNLKLHIKIQA
jgi:hypothetical protein